MSIISRWKERRRQKRKLREWRNLAQVYATLDMFHDRGLLEWNQRQRQLYIDSSLAYLMMKDAQSWQNFVSGVYTWLYDKECRKAWEDYMQKESLKAVREVSIKLPKGKTLSRQDIERIRDARRQEIAMSDMKAPKVEGFEFVVVHGTSAPDLTDPTKPIGIPVAVGHYSPDTERMEMATWQEVEMLLAQAKDNS